MNLNTDFRHYCQQYFARLCAGYAGALDDTGVRAWAAGHKNGSDAGGCFDMSSRMFPALAAWLGNADNPRTLQFRGKSIDLEFLVHQILHQAFDPEHAGFWDCDGIPVPDQRTVESSMVAYGIWLLRHTILPTISPQARGHQEKWLGHFGSQAHHSNWMLFLIANQTARRALGWQWDPSVVHQAWKVINSFERADGWMTDGGEGNFDDYNWWVFGTHELFWIQMTDGLRNAEEENLAQRIRKRISKRLELFPYFFGANGSYTEYGRSLAYKFARLGCPLLAYKMGIWPHSPGMLQRLVRRHLAYYDDIGAIDRQTQLLRQELSEFGNADIREASINTGHLYWAMQAFAALWQIAPGDPFWTAREDCLPVETADFQKSVSVAGWILCGHQASGAVVRYALGTGHAGASSAAKYGKFAYGTHFPFNCGCVDGEFGPDNALCLTDGINWAHPQAYDQFVATDEYLRARYRMVIEKQMLECATILVPGCGANAWCVRVHRVVAPVSGLSVEEGGFALGYAPGTVPEKTARLQVSSATAMGCTSAIKALLGYRGPRLPSAFRGHGQINAIHHRTVTPLLQETLAPGSNMLVCITATAIGGELEIPAVHAEWLVDDRVRITVDDRRFTVDPLPSH